MPKIVMRYCTGWIEFLIGGNMGGQVWIWSKTWRLFSPCTCGVFAGGQTLFRCRMIGYAGELHDSRGRHLFPPNKRTNLTHRRRDSERRYYGGFAFQIDTPACCCTGGFQDEATQP